MNSDSVFTLAELPEQLLEIIFLEDKENECHEERHQILPLADSEIFNVRKILNAKRLTYGENVKEVYLIELPSYGRVYEPGDTIGILPHNTDEDLMPMFNQLKINHIIHENCRIIQKKEGGKRLQSAFLDQTTTLYEIFKNYLDIRCLPKKSLIRIMLEYTKDLKERLMLEELCSKEGAKKYEEQILNGNKTFIDLLNDFATCCPPVVRLLESLPPLLPRPYSIASSPLSSPDRLRIVFTLASTVVNGKMRHGLCTGMLKSLVTNNNNNNNKIFSGDTCLKMFYRKKSEFKLPEDNNCPLILIGPGSGVAPFLGFLEHMKVQRRKRTIWLFYGCRFKAKDFLFRQELEEYVECGILTKLLVSFSREMGQHAKYVQDNMKIFGKEVCDMICKDDAIVYVCGDAKGLRKDVMNACVDILQVHQGLSSKEAAAFVRSLQKKKRYLQDSWL